MDSSWKIALGIVVIIMYIYSILEYRGIYWPLRNKYEELSNRRSFQKKTIKMQEEVQRSNEEFTVNVSNTFSGLEILKLNRIEDRFLLNSMKETDRLERRKANYFVFTFWQGRFSNFLGFITTILILYYVISTAGEDFDLARLMFTVSMASSTIWPITEIMPLFNVLKSNATIIENILKKDEDSEKVGETKNYEFEEDIEGNIA